MTYQQNKKFERAAEDAVEKALVLGGFNVEGSQVINVGKSLRIYVDISFPTDPIASL